MLFLVYLTKVQQLFIYPAFSLPEDVIKEAESAWSKIVAAVNTTQHSDLLQAHFLPVFSGSVASFPRKDDGG